MKTKVILLDENKVFVGAFNTHFDAVTKMEQLGLQNNYFNVSSGVLKPYSEWNITKEDQYPMVSNYPFSTYIEVEDEDGYCTLKVFTKSEEDAEILEQQIQYWDDLRSQRVDFIYFL